MAATATAKLASLTKVAAKAAPKKDDRTVLRLKPELEKKVADYVRLATLSNEVTPLIAQHKNDIVEELFLIWTQSMWDMRPTPDNRCEPSLPDNPRILIKKRDENGKETNMDDMSLLFQVKFKLDGLDGVVNTSKLPEGKTLQEALVELLQDPDRVGLTEENVGKLFHPNGEIDIEEQTMLADSLYNMLHTKDATLKQAAIKLVDYLRAGLKPENKRPVIRFCTTEELKAILVTEEKVMLKEGFFARVPMYCEDIEQMRKLLRLVKPTLQLGSVEFAIGDANSIRVDRLGKTVAEFLTIEE